MYENTSLPKVSIIIPIKNENDPFLPTCLDSLKNQDYSQKFEIIVIKGGNIAQARNLGIKNAKHEVVAFLDSDCVAPKNWLSILVNLLLSNTDVVGIGGYNISPIKSSKYSKIIDYIFSTYLGSIGSASLYVPHDNKYVNKLACINSIFWKRVLEKIDGFDEEFILCEDTNLSYKIRRNNFKLLFSPDIWVWHNRKDDICSFFKQFYNYGIGRMRSILTDYRYAELSIIFPYITSLFMLFLIIISPFSLYIYYLSFPLGFFIYGFTGSIKLKKIEYVFLISLFLFIEYFAFFCGLSIGIFKGRWKKTINISTIHRIYSFNNNEEII